MYRLSIVKAEPNPKYKPHEPPYYGGRNPQEMNPDIIHKSLEVDLTDEEFAAIKKAVLEVM